MSRFSKKLALLCAVGTLSLSLTGCHGSKGLPEFTVPEEFDTSRNYEITFWAKNDTNKTQTDIYKKAISDFAALYPNIKVDLRLYTDYGKIYNDVITHDAFTVLLNDFKEAMEKSQVTYQGYRYFAK